MDQLNVPFQRFGGSADRLGYLLPPVCSLYTKLACRAALPVKINCWRGGTPGGGTPGSGTRRLFPAQRVYLLRRWRDFWRRPAECSENK